MFLIGIYKKTLIIVGFSVLLIINTSFKPGIGNLHIQIVNFVGKERLQIDSVYKNALNQSFSVSNFKYYIGHIKLKNQNGNYFSLPEYFLVDEYEDVSKEIRLHNIPEGTYTSMEFIIGVDSLHNCSGTQSGALDPANGMFWAWNTGYIFFKLEGHAPSSKSPGTVFEYHIGGFKRPYNCIRKVTLPLNKGLLVSEGKTETINIKADVLEVLKTPTVIDFSKTSSVTDFNYSATIADNYADMFSILDK